VDMGNPHIVVVVDSLDEAGERMVSPVSCAEQFPDGVNIELVRVIESRVVEMRVFERGVGETWSCGTGACAVVAAVAGQDRPTTYAVKVRGGALIVTWAEDDHIHLKGPAALVAAGTWTA
nr:diaminopimelate epimerase [Propionibacteriales bacterium]